MKIKFLLTCAAFLLSAMAVNAVPAKPVKKTVRQADGTLIELTLRGDEHYSFYTADDGTPYHLKADGQLLKMTQEEVANRWTELRDKRLSLDSRRSRARMKSPMKIGLPGETTGKHRGLVILIQFKDVKFAASDPKTTFDRFFNEEGYHEYGNSGSVKDYFLKQSYGQLEIDFDVMGPYTTGGSLASYGAQDGNSHDANPTAMVMEAIDQAAKEVDFSKYDWNNDGEVDQVFIICAGYDQAEGADPDYIWPHEWSLGAQGIERRYNGKKINTYGVATELWGDGKTTNLEKEISGIGTACHEFSHCLGLPDFYDTKANVNYGMAYWSVMCAGNYNNNSHTPAGYTSYERMFAGWLEPTVLSEKTTVTGMKPLATTPEAYIIYNEANNNEFYLLENRQPVDFDAALYGHGMLVLHVEYDESSWSSNSVNTIDNRQRMTIIPADGSLNSTLASFRGDPFPGTSGNTALASYTTPSPTLYNANADGTYLNKNIDNIKESEDGLISFVACRPNMPVPEPGDGVEIEGEASFTVNWNAIEGAIGYEMEVTEIGSASDNPAEALEREFKFEEFETKSVGLSDVSSKLSTYGLSGWVGSKLFTSPNKLRLGTSTTAGYARTATWRVPQSSEMTVVIGCKQYKDDIPVKVLVRAAFGNQGDQATYDDASFEVTKEGYYLVTFSIRKDLFWLEIRPGSCMYMNYLAIYDGTWTAEQLGLNSNTASARQLAPQKASEVKVYQTSTNSITLKDLNTKSRYIYKVRAMAEDNIYSQWSEEKTFKFNKATGISPIIIDGKESEIYDLQGRRLGTSYDALPKGIYIIGGKKVVK